MRTCSASSIVCATWFSSTCRRTSSALSPNCGVPPCTIAIATVRWVLVPIPSGATRPTVKTSSQTANHAMPDPRCPARTAKNAANKVVPASATTKVTPGRPINAAYLPSQVLDWANAKSPQAKPPHGTVPRSASWITHRQGTQIGQPGTRVTKAMAAPISATQSAQSRLRSNQASTPGVAIQEIKGRKNTNPVMNAKPNPRRRVTRKIAIVRSSTPTGARAPMAIGAKAK